MAAPSSDRALLMGIAAITAVSTLVVVFFAWFLNRDTLPAKPAAFQPPPAVQPFLLYSVKASDPTTLTVTAAGGTTELTVPRPQKVEVVRVATIADLQVGDWVNVIGIIDEVRNFSIRAIVAIPGVSAPEVDGAGRSAGGFTGREVRTDPAERVMISGQVLRIEGDTLALSNPLAGTTETLRLLPRATLLRLEDGDPGAIGPGDLIASATALVEGQPPPVMLAAKSSASAAP